MHLILLLNTHQMNKAEGKNELLSNHPNRTEKTNTDTQINNWYQLYEQPNPRSHLSKKIYARRLSFHGTESMQFAST